MRSEDVLTPREKLTLVWWKITPHSDSTLGRLLDDLNEQLGDDGKDRVNQLDTLVDTIFDLGRRGWLLEVGPGFVLSRKARKVL